MHIWICSDNEGKGKKVISILESSGIGYKTARIEDVPSSSNAILIGDKNLVSCALGKNISFLFLSSWVDFGEIGNDALPIDVLSEIGGSARTYGKDGVFEYPSVSLVVDKVLYESGSEIISFEKNGETIGFDLKNGERIGCRISGDLPPVMYEKEIASFIGALYEEDSPMHTLSEHLKAERIARRIENAPDGTKVFLDENAASQAYDPSNGIVFEWMGRAEGIADEQ